MWMDALQRSQQQREKRPRGSGWVRVDQYMEMAGVTSKKVASRKLRCMMAQGIIERNAGIIVNPKTGKLVRCCYWRPVPEAKAEPIKSNTPNAPTRNREPMTN